MVAFLECLTELAAHIQTRDKNFRLPYKVDNDKLEGVSIKLQYSSEENWTKALKYTLTNLKALVVWAIQQDNDATI
jgi:beclin 1